MVNTGPFAAGDEGDIDLLNSMVLQRGTFANRPTFGQAGRIYEATDYGIYYRDDGSAWNELPRLGGVADESEVTTTSTSEDDRVTISGLSIPTTTPFLVVANYRRTTGASTQIRIGLKLNSTTIYSGRDIENVSANEAASGVAVWTIGRRDTTYLRTSKMIASIRGTSSIGVVQHFEQDNQDMPNAAITDVIVRGRVGDALVTLGIKGVAVYLLPNMNII